MNIDTAMLILKVKVVDKPRGVVCLLSEIGITVVDVSSSRLTPQLHPVKISMLTSYMT